jgi:hypothetical protein
MNINDYVHVKLTESGFDIIKNSIYSKSILQYHHIKNNEYEIQLWELMNIFGEHCYMGNTMQPFFEDNCIEIANK